MSGFSELIKNFDKTRDYIRDFFIYGFKIRSEYSMKSSRTYDDEKRRTESWFGDFLKFENTKRGKHVFISADSGKIYENPLYKAYYSKSFTDNDIKLHFLLSDILSEGNSLPLREITDRLLNDYNAFFDEQTVRNKLKEYVKEGIFVSEKHGKTDYFSLSTDTAESFFNVYGGLDDFVKFFSEAAEFGIVGNSILKAVDMQNDIFLFKHNYIVHTLEDEILLRILDAMDNKKLISVMSVGKKREAFESIGVPLKIHVSTQTGRRYLIMYLLTIQKIHSFRLDSIKKIKALKEYPDYDTVLEKYNADAEKTFGVSFGNYSERTSTVVITFFVNEENEKFIIERLQREKRCGTFQKAGENLFTLTFEVFDPNELMYWLKSFIGRIVNIEGAGEFVTEKFKSDIQRLYEMYCKEEITV